MGIANADLGIGGRWHQAEPKGERQGGAGKVTRHGNSSGRVFLFGLWPTTQDGYACTQKPGL
jgi:hypothetical protein